MYFFCTFIVQINLLTSLLTDWLAGWLTDWLTEVEGNDDDDDDDDNDGDDGILAYYPMTVHIDWWQTLSVTSRVFRQFQSNP